MTFATSCSPTRVRAAFRRGSVIRVAVVMLFVASTAMIVSAVTPGVAAASQTAWSAPLDVDASNLLSSVSCASRLFCAAVDSTGHVLTYNGASWSIPNKITEGNFNSVSCPSTTFCVAVETGGEENTWNGSSWNGPSPVGTDTSTLEAVSCTSSHFCVAVDSSGGADIWNGTSWTGPTLVDANHGDFLGVSCASPTFCVAVDSDPPEQGADAYRYDGTHWTSFGTIDPGGYPLESVSCTNTNTTFCVAVDLAGNALTYNGSSWSSSDIDGTTQLNAVSCATPSFCVAGDISGNALTYNGSSWSSVTIDNNAITAVSCPTTSFCAGTDDAGNAMTYGWVSAGYNCGSLGTWPVLLSESPSPPSSIAAPGTFQTTLSVDVTIPASAINIAISAGVTSVTIGSQSVTVDGLTAGSPSSSVSPNTLTTSATNLPITFTPQMNTPYTFATTYNPETWQTANVPGTVDFTPGNIGGTFTYVISGSPSQTSVSCTPPSGVTALDTTNVTSPGPTPSFQVPPSVPPLQSQVSAPFDAGWAIEIANTSTVSVNGLSAQVTVHGGGTLTYDLAGMANTGTTCSASGANMITCTVGTLSGGATKTLNVLVKTTGLAQGTSINGSANVTSSNAPSQSSSLSAINVVVVPNGTTAVAVPNVSLTSTTANLSVAGAKSTLKLPKKVVMGPFESGPLTKVKGPPVSVTLVPLAGSQDPALCPPSSGGCEGEIMEIEGNFASYTSTSKPISAVIEIFYGSSVPTGHMYFQSTASSSPSLLPACVLTGVNYNTPCVNGPEQIIGKTGKLGAKDTIFFTGGDPLVGRR